MKVGDLVMWCGHVSLAFPGPRTGVLLDKVEIFESGTLPYYWRVFIEGKTVLMDETYLEVIHESR